MNLPSLTARVGSYGEGLVVILERSCRLLALLLFVTRPTVADIVWSEEFDGSRIDRDTWIHDVGGHGFGNGQLEYNTARPENSYIEDGCLVIEARRERYRGKLFTSARLATQGRFAYRYGSLEARIRVPNTANGLWPAFWMLGNNFPGIAWPHCGEIDILEMGGKEGIARGLQRRRMNSALHYSGSDEQKDSKEAWHDAPVDLDRGYHLYRVDWTPDRLSFHRDGVQFGAFDIRADHLREFHQPFFLILNLAVGSRSGGYTGIDSSGAITADLPAKLSVDWIRLSANRHTELFLGADTAETGRFGVFSESRRLRRKVEFADGSGKSFPYGSRAALHTWNNMTRKVGLQPAEGQACWTFDVGARRWFGMGVSVPSFRDMQNYSDGRLHFDIRATSGCLMRVGIKSSRGGESWLPLGDGDSEFGFARDGTWHSVAVPLNRYSNIDFRTVHQLFMLAGEPPSEDFQVSVDNVWWEPSAPRPRPLGPTFGIFTETASHKRGGEFRLGEAGNFFVWERTLSEGDQRPFEGRESKSLRSRSGLDWFGAAFTPDVKHDLSAFGGPKGRLCFSMRTTSRTTFLVGIKSGNLEGIGESWIRFVAGRDPYAFSRDGQWHTVEIPMSVFSRTVDLSEVSQLFQLLGTSGGIGDLEIDDIYLTAGGTSR